MATIPFRVIMFLLAILTGMITSYSVFAQDEAATIPTAERYDRLDGTGDSGKKVDVIEWEGNLEIHAAPLHSLKGFSAKLDDRDPGKKVMVVGYRFANTPRPLVRRAILGVPFNAKVKAFIDPTEKDYDKIALTNHDMTAPWVPYKLEASPKQWYPDGDERNGEDAAPATKPVLSANPKVQPSDLTIQKPQVDKGAPVTRVPASEQEDNDGAIKAYSW